MSVIFSVAWLLGWVMLAGNLYFYGRSEVRTLGTYVGIAASSALVIWASAMSAADYIVDGLS